jgi:phosphate transport system substrate-binding protein
MKHNIKFLLAALGLIAVFQNCTQAPGAGDDGGKPGPNQTKVVVDESFQPIVDEELYIFKALYDKEHPVVSYAPENSAVNLFLNDSVRVAILSRDLTKQEYAALRARNAIPYVSRFAIDAVTIIVNQASNDTLITVSDVKKMLNGAAKQDKNIVFDNPNSGLVRYLKDLSGARAFEQKNIYALQSNKDVIKYVSEHPNSIGIVGFSWLNDPDKDYADAVNKVKIVSVMDDVTKGASKEYFSPSQNTLALKEYPLTRNLYILRNTSNLGLKLEAFLISDRGQRIIMKSGLLPDDIPSRRINVIKKLKTKA